MDLKDQNKRLKNRLLVLNDLVLEEREWLSVELYKLCEEIFGNVSYDEFCHYITQSGAKKTYLMLYHNSVDELVGFFALHLFELEVDGKRELIFRGQTGLIQKYRRSKANMYFALYVILYYRIVYPFTSINCFLAIISPSMYAVLAKRLAIIEPSYKQETTTKKLLLIEKLRKVFDFEKEESESVWTSPVGWISIASEEEKNYWKSSHNPYIRYYLKLNPNFEKGVGLITLIPFSWRNIFLSSFKVLNYICKKAYV